VRAAGPIGQPDGPTHTSPGGLPPSSRHAVNNGHGNYS
jgi:hypothetical protein